MDAANPPRQPERSVKLLDWAAGGWTLAVSGLLCVLIVAYWASRLPLRTPTIGDGRTVASYGFDLSTALIPADQIRAGGFPKDGLPALTNPEVFTIAQADAHAEALKRAHQGKFLVAPDRVVAVRLNGQARAYPLKILNWHEVVNDTLGGEPICVTYNPLCDSAAVFSRRVGDDVLEFGVSGLLYNSNLLMYDRRAAPGSEASSAGESLWSQLQCRAVAGPAAARGARLDVLPAAVMPWGEWQSLHAGTTVLAPDRSREKLYRRTYEPYFGNDRLRFPVSPAAPGGLPKKTPVLAVADGERWRVFKLPDVAALVDRDSGSWSPPVSAGGSALRIQYRGGEHPTAWAQTPDGELAPSVTAFWFAWYAMHGE